MNRSIEQALTNLIPRLNGPLPPDLVELASSLLAQSRNKASNLKAEEEVGRAYACCNIACERLKKTLDLPPIEQRPPIPPKVYKKLYAYLDQALPQKARKRAGEPIDNDSRTNTPTKRTAGSVVPGSHKTISAFQNERTPKKGLKVGNAKDRDARIPKWVVPVIRLLCRESDAAKAMPHVLAGVESLLTLPCPEIEETPRKRARFSKGNEAERQGSEEIIRGKIPALIAAIYVYVEEKLSGGDFEAKAMKVQRRKALKIVQQSRSDEALVARFGEDWTEWEDLDEEDVDKWLQELATKGWVHMDWYENIQSGSGLDLDPDAYDDGDGDGEDDGREGLRIGMRRGLGTMMQHRVDYLSEERREDYKQWKAAVLVKIDELLQAKAGQGSET
ncbi:hypothetical protein BP5796_08142 [Coleophoma crateriformis]|uniref:ORC6 first cyclin-like domain-containing protein n=1 Tax=Coleophoma crateriformis TaxID=565419 RepID=A0A3D8RDW3_9HELO|nr:hypothetical protein BP5796_08142 [Coleophoma crateriformis]